MLEQDLILQMKFDAATGRLSPNTPGEITTKRAPARVTSPFTRTGGFSILITETTATVGAYAIDQENGTLKELQFVDMLAGTPKEQPAAADLHVTPDGRFLYGSERRQQHPGRVPHRPAQRHADARRTLRDRDDAARLRHRAARQVPARRSVSIRTT